MRFVFLALILLPSAVFANDPRFLQLRSHVGREGMNQFNGVCVGNPPSGCLIVTVAHGLRGASAVDAAIAGSWRECEQVSVAPEYDLALLRVPGVRCDAIPLASEPPPEGATIRLQVWDYDSGVRWAPFGGLFRSRPPGGVKFESHNFVQSGPRPCWQFQGRIKPGYSGGAMTYNGRLVGIIHSGNESFGFFATIDQIRGLIESAGYSKPQSSTVPTIPATQQEREPAVDLPRVDLGEPARLVIEEERGRIDEDIEQARNRDKLLYESIVGINRRIDEMNSRVEQVSTRTEETNSIRVEEVESATEPDDDSAPADVPQSRIGTGRPDTPALHPSGGGVSGSLISWMLLAAGASGTVATVGSMLVPIVYSRIKRRRKRREEQQQHERHSQNNPPPDVPPEWPKPESTACGCSTYCREKPPQTVERVVRLDGKEREQLKAKIAQLRGDLENAQQQINYPAIEVDAGLHHMRQAMKRVAETYPASRPWVKTIEATYSLELSGDKRNG
ncbi:trypsin-like peptidase domain-containing protein [bacterium]|nr:trypsin-like peptidase domain-containing protein [bacterium]